MLGDGSSVALTFPRVVFVYMAIENAGTVEVKHTHLKKKKKLWSALRTQCMLTFCIQMGNESSVFAVASSRIHWAKLAAGCSGIAQDRH